LRLGERPAFESSQLIFLDDDALHLISNRLTNALGVGGHSVIVNVDKNDKEPFLTISSMLDTSSQSLARVQVAGSIKSGIALFIQGACLSDGQTARFISILNCRTIYLEATNR
jgi:hypothetical protein